MPSKSSILLVILAVVISFGSHQIFTASADTEDGAKQSKSTILVTESNGNIHSNAQEYSFTDKESYAQSLINFGYTPEQAQLRADYVWELGDLATKNAPFVERDALAEEYLREFNKLNISQ